MLDPLIQVQVLGIAALELLLEVLEEAELEELLPTEELLLPALLLELLDKLLVEPELWLETELLTDELLPELLDESLPPPPPHAASNAKLNAQGILSQNRIRVPLIDEFVSLCECII